MKDEENKIDDNDSHFSKNEELDYRSRWDLTSLVLIFNQNLKLLAR